MHDLIVQINKLWLKVLITILTVSLVFLTLMSCISPGGSFLRGF